MRILWTIPIILALSACATSEELAAQRDARHEQRCQNLGAETQQQMFSCKMELERQAIAVSEAQGRAFQQMGHALLTQPQQVYQPAPRWVSCNTHSSGAMLHTHCW